LTSHEGYQRIEIDSAKVEVLVKFLISISKGPSEAIALLHTAIQTVDIINANLINTEPQSPEALGQELTTGLLLAQGSVQ